MHLSRFSSDDHPASRGVVVAMDSRWIQSVTEQENIMTDLSTYGDEEKLSSILDVLKQAGLFGEIISVKSLVNDDDLDTEDEDWVDVQTKYGHDTSDYVFGDHSEERAGTISLETEPVSGHDWVGPTIKTGRMIYVATGTKATCGRKEADCFDIECKHVPILELEEEIRHEFKQDWNSMADRPTENFFLGLAGLRYVEIDQQYFTRLNTVCSECNLYTPSRLELCQNCDRVLVSK